MAADEVEALMDKMDFRGAVEKLCDVVSKGGADEIKSYVDTIYSSYKGSKDKMREVVMLTTMAQIAISVNDPDKALEKAKLAVDLVEVALDTRALIGPAMKALANAHLLKDSPNYAKKTASDMMSRGQGYGQKDTMASARILLARSYLAIGADYLADAADAADKALAYFKGASSTSKDTGLAMMAMAEVYYAQDKVQDGVNMADQAVAMLKELGFTKEMAKALQVLIQGYSLQNNPMAGLRAANTELNYLRRAGVKRAQADIMMVIAETHAMLGETVGALKNAKSALELYQSLGDKFAEASTLLTISEMLRAQGDKVEATAAVQTAMKIFKSLGSTWGQEQAKETLSLLLVERGQPEKAPNRAAALKALEQLVRAIRKKNAIDLKEAEAKLDAMQGLVTEQDIADALQPVFADPSVLDFLIAQGWEFKKGKQKKGDGKQFRLRVFDHHMTYINHIYGGMNFGPQFRHVHGARTDQDAKEFNNIAMTVSQVDERVGVDDWQTTLKYKPGILDAFQVLGCMGPYAVPEDQFPQPDPRL
jgi:tetratricopeptide (TPR) repeat protein